MKRGAFAVLVFVVAFQAPGVLGASSQVGRVHFINDEGLNLGTVEPLESKEEQLIRATTLGLLEFYMQAGIEKDAGRGAKLLSSFYVDARRAVQDTRRLYREREKLFSEYVTLSSDIYGCEYRNDRFGASFDIEGGIETEAGLTAEFRASMVYRDNRWLIWELDID